MAVPLGPKEPARGDYWRGDLLRAMLFFEQNSGDFVSFASQLGYEYHPRISVDLGPTDYDGQGCETEVIEPELSITPAEVRNIIHEFWVPVFYPYSLSQNKNGSRKLDATSDTSVSLICDSNVRLPEVKYIASWPELRNRLEPFLSLARPSRRVDTQMLVRRISRGDAIRKVPFLHRKRVKDHITLVKDMSLRCVPYRLDQEMIAQRLSTLAIRGGLKVLNGASPFGLTSPTRAVKSSLSSRSSRNRKSRYIDPEPGSDVLILGDLGVLLKTGIQSARTLTNGIPTSNWQGDGEDVQDWYHACRRWSLLGCRIFALVPYSTMLIAPSFRHWVHPIAWQGNAFDGISGKEQVANLEMLLTIASPAQRVEPGLLREFRRLSPGIGDASIEAVYWQDSRHLGPRLDAIKQPRNSSRQGFLKRFEKLDPKLIHQTLLWMRRYRLTSGANVLWQTELMNLPVHLRALIDPNHEDQKIAIRTYQAFDWQRQEGGPHGISDRLTSIAMDASEHAIEDLDIGPTVQRIRMEYMPGEASSSLTRLDGVRAGEKAFRVQIRGRAEGLEVSSKAFGQVEPKGLFSSRTNTEVCLSTDKGLIEIKGLGGVRQGLSEQVFWKSGRKPEWVSDYGTDQYGAWCEFQVPRHDGKGMVTQRMRWIKPGDFMMGSPEGEKERFEDEVPQHRVILSHGYWMADSQVTQELWMAMRGGENPSRFKGERNPVEGVSWEDCQAWISKLGLHHESLKISLPTEAQWEYACRAGSTTAYCFGDDSKELINYGWFKENAEQTTIPVNQLQPNNWGLYDMHGNVWEWCSDWYGEYEKSASFDPTGPAKGTYRVMRGGGWVDPSRLLRSHCRFGLGSGYRNDTLGFRIAGSGQGAEPSERAMLPVAEQGTERARAIQVWFKEKEPSRRDSFWKSGTKPQWVSDYGRDNYGLWCEFQVPRYDEKGLVTQRMRWIKPGTFLMGSTGEEKKLEVWDETQHEVTLTQGYWLADTQVTQNLWKSMGGKNPSWSQSWSQSDAIPVEQISWEDCQEWLRKVSKAIRTLELSLPTEAQWEYACRAGSTKAYCFGDDPKELPKYGWFRENSKFCAHPVKQLEPNDWGLYDMHGNVWEWCRDWYGNYLKIAMSDPTGPARGTYRVLRGGCWFNPARLLRSACRGGNVPGHRSVHLGFRLLSSALGAEPSERAMLPVAEQGTERVRIGTADIEYRFVCSIGLGAKDAIQLEREFSHIKVDAYSSIRIATEQEEYQFDRLTKPTWAVDFGADDYGLYATLEITLERVNKESKGIARWFRRKQSELDSVRQRMRWIPPGRFMMGSPDGKDYGISGQYPQHEVIITHGYWMFETPCTQGLWSALMGKNPSYFSDDDRPVESVRWEEAVDFAAKLNERMSESYPTDGRSLVAGWDRLMFRLPTEAEWEYACRAGTTSDTYAGDLELESNDAAKSGILDSIAWYGGNSGHMYDLETGVEMTWLRDLRDEENMGGTRKVGKKHPNPWGLYDMLGNVWEWCQDWYGEYSVERLVDPFGPSQGTSRVLRGGGWLYPARFLRSACRGRFAPGLRNYDLGFRLLSSAFQVDQATESGN